MFESARVFGENDLGNAVLEAAGLGGGRLAPGVQAFDLGHEVLRRCQCRLSFVRSLAWARPLLGHAPLGWVLPSPWTCSSSFLGAGEVPFNGKLCSTSGTFHKQKSSQILRTSDQDMMELHGVQSIETMLRLECFTA